MRGAAGHLNGGAGWANGPPCGPSRTRSPPTNAAAAATRSTGRQYSTGTAQRTRWGSAEPSVNAPTRTPIASPRPSRYHPATIFIPGGYTPASAAPVSIRSAIPVPGPGANATPRVARPARQAQAATSRRADQRSDSVSSADTSAPTTKPSCTEIVSHAAPAVSSRHRRESAGATAEAENHGAIPHNSDAARRASTRRAFTDPSDGPETSKANGTARGDARPAP